MNLPDWITNTKKAKKFHMWAVIFFLVQIPIALLTPLKDSVPYLVFLSLWALVGSHWSAWQAVRAEQNGN